ncbi:MAG TPA: TonB-dependent receptor [Luteimonas sp.]|nr:TonB-dependent receptor [Luteimonas sp.]
MAHTARLVLSASILAALAAGHAYAQSPAPAPATRSEPEPARPDAQAAPRNPAAPASAPATAAPPTDPASTTELDTIVVTGLRSSLASAQATKQDSDQIVDSIVAEDIGKLPDVTASDSLARVPGVQVSRGGGEAGQVLVRGLPDIATSYNGRDIFTAEARFVAVQDFPAGGVSALQVYKSTTADLVEGGIAGLINVQSRRPFDFEDREIAGGLRYTYTNQSQHYDPNWNLLASDRWQTDMGEFGALINVSYTQMRYLDSARFNGGFIAGIRPEQVEDPSLVGARLPDAVGIFYGEGDRSRPSLNAAFQWRPNDALELYSDVLYQGFRNKVSDRQLFVPLYGDADFSNVVLRPGTSQVQSLTASNQVRPELFQGATDNETDTSQLAVGGIWNADAWRISMDLARTVSKYESSIYSYDTAFTGAPTVDVDFDTPREEGGVEFAFDGFDTRDPANFVYRGFFDRYLEAKGDDLQFRTDFQYNTDIALLPKLEFGVRYVDRDGSFDNGERYAYQEPLGLGLADTGLDIGPVPGGFHGSNVQPTRTWISPTYDSIRGNIDALRDLAGFASGNPAFNPVQAFEANEKSRAAYGQFRYEFGEDVPVDGVVGIRVVKTEVEMVGFSREIVDGTEIFSPRLEQSEYTDYLPTASMRIRFMEGLQLRLSGNQTRTRPNFSQLNPGLFIDPNPDPSGFRNASGGNIDLQPIESTNYDVSLERYFSPSSFASVGVFRRDVSGFIVNGIETVQDPVYGELRINRPINLNETRLDGVEAQVTTFFDYDFMPEWSHGFGIQLNGTYIDGDLPGISKNSYNAVGMYEQGPFSARLAYNTRSKFLNVTCETGGNPGCEYTDDVSRLDLSLNWTPVEDLTLTFDVSNILGEPLQTYRDYQDGAGETLGTFPRDVRFEETVYSLGLRFRY